jgi:hypothetical protein
VAGGILEEACANELRKFFRGLRGAEEPAAGKESPPVWSNPARRSGARGKNGKAGTIPQRQLMINHFFAFMTDNGTIKGRRLAGTRSTCG